jgi:hypothetical protein
MPIPDGPPKGYVHTDGTQHVTFIDDGDIHEMWWNGSWHYNNLSTAAAAPVKVAGIGRGYVEQCLKSVDRSGRAYLPG